MKLITEEVAKVKFITEGKGAKRKCTLKVSFFKEKSKTAMVECTLLILSLVK
tara:strand:+ start:340 stop:495 length:156 start_codon:yes stop_codon:yes gene_type:complete